MWVANATSIQKILDVITSQSPSPSCFLYEYSGTADNYLVTKKTFVPLLITEIVYFSRKYKG